MLYKGSCHCGRIAFEVDTEIKGAVACNCSICSRKGALLSAAPREALRLLGSDEGLRSYTFNNHAIVHRFCETCGIHPFAEQLNAPDGPAAYVNLRCIEGLDLQAIPVIEFDGRSL
jgi:hypothetical protein